MENRKQVIIIGAGPAGLAAAHRLLRDDATGRYAVTLLEASDRIGGISMTVEHNGNRMDMGGHRFFTKVEEVNRWWAELMPLEENGADPAREDLVLMRRSRLSRIYFNNTFFPYPLELKPSLLGDLGLMDSLRVMGSYVKSLLFKREEKSLEDFYINRFGKELYSMFFEYYTENLWGVHPRDISPDWGMQRVKGLSIWVAVKDMLCSLLHIRQKKETSLIDAFHYPKYGPGQMWERVAHVVRDMGADVRLNTVVTGVDMRDGRVCGVRVHTGGQEQLLPCDEVISSMPLCELIAGMDDVPQPVRDCASVLPYRDFMTIGVLIPKAALTLKARNQRKGEMKDNWIYVQDRRVKLGRIQVFNNWSPYMVADPEHMLWLGLEYFCTEGEAVWNMSDKDFAAMAMEELRTIGFVDDAACVKDFRIQRVKKAYPAYFGVYKDIQCVREYINSIPNLICIGRNGQHRYNNMDHSVLTGFYAAECIQGVRRDKASVWEVNTEKVYHEEK